LTATGSKPFRVVIADDVADLRFLLQRALEASGRFQVVGTAANGRQAVDAATEHQPDLTLLDLSMPVMDGLEALPLIRTSVPECTVVVLSGFDADAMETTARQRGAAGYLVKGVSPKRLVQELLAVLEDIRGLPDAPATAGDGPRAQIDLPANLASGSRARVFLADHLCRWDMESLLDTAQLLTTELVANAVIHARSAVTVTVRSAEERLRVEVSDTGAGALTMREANMEATGGRGLLLIEALSAAWGTSADGDGKLVWFELVDDANVPTG
jgi:CheY-like chemotaxis protein/anti-sigma regulatory factor (Ser/Thr protein kinase)